MAQVAPCRPPEAPESQQQEVLSVSEVRVQSGPTWQQLMMLIPDQQSGELQDLVSQEAEHMEKSDGRTIRKSPAHSPLISFFPLQ